MDVRDRGTKVTVLCKAYSKYGPSIYIGTTNGLHDFGYHRRDIYLELVDVKIYIQGCSGFKTSKSIWVSLSDISSIVEGEV